MTTPTPADRPADQLRAAAECAPGPELARLLTVLADASDHHRLGEGGVVATLVHPALAVARQLLGTNVCGPVPDSCGDEPCANHEREQAHAEGEHAFCGPECAAALAADYASCPGYETSPNPCRCPCYGCKHHCSAHQPPAAPPAPADRAAGLREGARALISRQVETEERERAAHGDLDHETVLMGEAVRDAAKHLVRLAADAAAGVQPLTSEAEVPIPLAVGDRYEYRTRARTVTVTRLWADKYSGDTVAFEWRGGMSRAALSTEMFHQLYQPAAPAAPEETTR
ncbi:hypothetical protein ABXI76_05500 [Streptomyces parvus]